MPRVVLDLDHVERRTGGYAESLALADRKIVHAGVLANYLAVGGDHLAGNVGRRVALLTEIGFEKALVVAAGDEADFLRVGLLGDRQAVLAGKFAHLRLGHAAEREQSAAQLFLRKAKEEIGLVFGLVDRAL